MIENLETELKNFVETYSLFLDRVKSYEYGSSTFKDDLKNEREGIYIPKDSSSISFFRGAREIYDSVFIKGIHFTKNGQEIIFRVGYKPPKNPIPEDKVEYGEELFSNFYPGLLMATITPGFPFNAYLDFIPPIKIEWKKRKGYDNFMRFNKSRYGEIHVAIDEGDGVFFSVEKKSKNRIHCDLDENNKIKTSKFDINDLGTGELLVFLSHLGMKL